MENNKTPSIRFKGFTDPWEQRKLGEVLSFLKDGTHGTHADADDGPLLLSAKNIKNGEIYWDETDRRISYDEYEKIHSKFLLESGDVLLTIVGSIGETAILKDSEGVTFQRSVAFLRPNNKITSDFLYSEIQTPTFQKELDSRKSTSAQPGIYLGDLAEIPVTFTTKIAEQKKIGEYFRSLDHLITLHQRKYNKLLNVKKSMLEKMFPKNESNIPEIRFKGFTDPWEQRKFTDITFLSGEKNKDNLPYESYSVTNENGFVPQNEQFENGGTMATADKRMYYIVSKNSFAYNPARINVGSIGYYDGPENVIVSSLYEVFKTSEDIDDRYLWHWFKSNNFKKLIEQYQEGGVRLYFYYDKLCMCSLPTPSIQEQIKIGRYFDNLDNLITLHQRELEKLQNIKKSMLEKMFV